MANEVRELASTIDDYLLSIAAGLRKAQEEFDALATGPDASGTTYAVPKLDFKLKMTVNISDAPAIANKYKLKNKPLRPGKKFLVLKPVSMADVPASGLKGEAVSTIDASFVSVPANGGKTPILLESVIREISNTEAQTVVEVFTADGRPVVNAVVEFNLDREASLLLNENRALQPGTDFEKAVIRTDKDGTARGLLKIAETESSSIIIAIDAENQTEIVNYQFIGGE
jgi:hypothetical protein